MSFLLMLNIIEDVIVLKQFQSAVYKSLQQYLQHCNFFHFRIAYSFKQSTYNSNEVILLC
jgi:hypothetical protein